MFERPQTHNPRSICLAKIIKYNIFRLLVLLACCSPYANWILRPLGTFGTAYTVHRSANSKCQIRAERVKKCFGVNKCFGFTIVNGYINEEVVKSS